MSFNEQFPQDDSYIADFPAGDREQNRALKEDQIVNAGKLQGLVPSNDNGQIPINNGNENKNLNAGLLNGKTSADFAPKEHLHTIATKDSNGYMSNIDKQKLDGISSGAEVNQNAFSNIKVNTTTIQADSKTDTLELVAGTNISITPDANNDKITIALSGKVNNAINADNATKATQDSKGQQIDTTYIKSITGSNDSLTITKGNETTSKVTINNVANATKATNADSATNATTATKVVQGSQYYLQAGGGGTDENNVISQNKANVVLGSWYSTGFRDLCTSGTPIRVAINHRNGNIKTLETVTASKFNGTATNADNATKATNDSSNRNIVNTYATISTVNTKAPLASPILTGTPTAPTPATSINNTQIATTAFVHSLINSMQTSIGAGIVASNLASNGYVKFSNGLLLQWGITQQSPFVLPISFNTIIGAVPAQTNGNDERHIIVTKYAINQIEYKLRGYSSHSSMESSFWLAIGK